MTKQLNNNNNGDTLKNNNHSFFIHSSVDGHLGCFYVLGLVNSASVNTGVHVSFSVMAF